ncbi:MAG: SIS domain-containing protein [Chloroflexi bacterium]|nr:SIS domain-containing protein [Chloroflexota bacterium]
MNEIMLREIKDQPAALEGALVDLRRQVGDLDLGPPPRKVILTGSGDSIIAGTALESLYRRSLSADVRAISSMEASRYERFDEATLVVAVSVSGGVARTIEAVLRARAQGARALAVVGRPGSRLAEAAGAELLMAEPLARHTPHSRDYTQTLLALAILLEHLAATRFQPLDRWPEATRDVLDRAFAELPGWVEDSPQTIFLGAGPDRATARYGALKFWEGGAMRAIWDELEEFAHGSQLMAAPGHSAVLIGGAEALGRAQEFLVGLARMEISARLVTDRPPRSPERFVVPDLGGAAWMPLVSCLPLQVLTYLTVQRREIDLSVEMGGAPYGPLYGEMHVEWTKHSAIDTDLG